MALVVSAEFEELLQKNGVFHITSAPYYSASNGLAECFVHIIKKGLKKVTDGSNAERLTKALISYPITPQATRARAPSEMLRNGARSRLDLIKPHTAECVEKKQQQKLKHDATARARMFQVDDSVWFKNLGSDQSWLPGRITEKLALLPLQSSCLMEDSKESLWGSRLELMTPLVLLPPVLRRLLLS